MISIILPSYNRAHRITSAIDSILAQTNPNWELLLVDDASTDTTEQVVAPYLKDKRIHYFKNTSNQERCESKSRHTRSKRSVYLFFR